MLNQFSRWVDFPIKKNHFRKPFANITKIRIIVLKFICQPKKNREKQRKMEYLLVNYGKLTIIWKDFQGKMTKFC